MAEPYDMSLWLVTFPRRSEHGHGWLEIVAVSWEQAADAASEAMPGWVAVNPVEEFKAWLHPAGPIARWFVCPGCRLLHKAPCCSQVPGDADCGPCCALCPTCPTEIELRRPRNRGLAITEGGHQMIRNDAPEEMSPVQHAVRALDEQAELLADAVTELAAVLAPACREDIKAPSESPAVTDLRERSTSELVQQLQRIDTRLRMQLGKVRRLRETCEL